MNTNLQDIADEIAGISDGSFYLEKPESYCNLSVEDQEKVMSLVYEQIYTCDSCGWWFNTDSLDQTDSGEHMCWNCYDNYEEEQRENNDV